MNSYASLSRSVPKLRRCGKAIHRGLCLALLLLGPAHAQYYDVIRFRQNDPFLFCHDGYEPIRANACWYPLPPYTGGLAWDYTWICDPPNQYGRPWTDRDDSALVQYKTVCPHAITSGEWSGSGSPAAAPTPH